MFNRCVSSWPDRVVVFEVTRQGQVITVTSKHQQETENKGYAHDMLKSKATMAMRAKVSALVYCKFLSGL
jgi:hypothetical protein